MRRKSTEGAYTITGPGIDSSSVSLGAAISKALTLGSRAQRELSKDEVVRSIYVRKLGEETAARIDVTHESIRVLALQDTR